MPAKSAKSGGFSADDKAAMKARAEELRAEGKKGAKKADGEMWPVSFALTTWSPAVEKKVAALMKSAIS